MIDVKEHELRKAEALWMLAQHGVDQGSVRARRGENEDRRWLVHSEIAMAESAIPFWLTQEPFNEGHLETLGVHDGPVPKVAVFAEEFAVVGCHDEVSVGRRFFHQFADL